MPPKRNKSRAGGSSKLAGDKELASVLLNEEGKWSASLALVVGNQVEDRAHIEALVTAVNGGTRKLFSSLTREDLFSLVSQFGSSKSPSKGKDVPQFSEICEPCKQHLENGEEIPLPLLAKLIKFKLLDIKNQDIKRREVERKALEERDKPSKGKSDKRDASKSPAKAGKKSVAGKAKPAESSITKSGSKLVKRGEEDLSAKYINDEPDNGPEHYVVITGFHHPHLLTYLVEIGVNVDAIINVNSQSYNSSGEFCRVGSADSKVDPAVVTGGSGGGGGIDDEQKRKEDEKISTELKKFWQDVVLVMDKAPENSSLHDVARLEYMVPDFTIPLESDAEAKTAFGAMLFEVVACMMYNLLDAKRQWKNYLKNLRLVQVHQVPAAAAEVQDHAEHGRASPMVSRSQSKLDSALDFDGKQNTSAFEVDMRHYNDLMNCIPMESVSVPLIMHCMLEQVSVYDQPKSTNPDASANEKSDCLDDGFSQHLNTLAFKLALTVEERKVLFPDYNPPFPRAVDAEEKQPLLVSFHDEITRRLNHLEPMGSFNPVEAELRMLGFSPASKLISHSSSDSDSRMVQERAARFQELLFFCNQQGIYSKSNLGHALQQFVLECMNLTTVDEDGRIYRPKGQQNDIPWDDPFPYYVGMIPTAKSQRAESQDQDQDLAIDGESAREQLSSGGSILKRPESHNSRKRASSCHSVHFEEDASGQLVLHPGDENAEEDNVCAVSSGSNRRSSLSSVHSGSQLTDTSNVITDNSKRNLDKWQYAEHLESKILLQALVEALQSHPFVDTYYQKRDDTLLIVFHNPRNPTISHSCEDWHVALHSNVRFRNYLEFVAGGIEEWTRSEEAKYEANLLAEEVERLRKAEETGQITPGDKKRPGRSKSPKKAETPDNGSARSPSSSTERMIPCGSFVRAGSLKAWKEEQARLKEEEEEQERLAEEKRVKSSQKKLKKDDVKPKVKDNEKENKKHLDPKHGEKLDPAGQELNKATEKDWPFNGYDIGNKIIHLAGITSTLFPDDGGQILTERIQYLHGTTSVRATVRKNGNSFTVHVIDPKPVIEENDEVEKPGSPEAVKVDGDEEQRVVCGNFEDNLCATTCKESPKSDGNKDEHHKCFATDVPQSLGRFCDLSSLEKHQHEESPIGRFGSFTTQFSDGMMLSMSCFGPSGEPPNGKPYEPDPYAPPVVVVAPATGGATDREASPGKRTKANEKANKDKDKDKQNQPEALPAPTEAEIKEEVSKDMPAVPEPFQQIYVACPDGLSVTYALESFFGISSLSDKKRILVRQSYPFKVKSSQKCDGARKTSTQEQSRMITSDGTVIKTMLDGSTKFLFADGTVSEFCFSSSLVPTPLVVVPDPQQVVKDSVSPTTKKKVRRRSLKGSQQGSTTPFEEDLQEKGYWITTLPSGERIANRVNGVPVQVPDAIVYAATDPRTLQVMHTRDDHVVTVCDPDGLMIVEHSDGTRITTKRQEIVEQFCENVIEIDDDKLRNAEQPQGIEACETQEEDQTEFDQETILPEAKEHEDESVPNISSKHFTEAAEKLPTTREVVKFVLVECPGYSSVKFDESSGLCSCEFGSGCIIDCTTSGRYDVFHQTGSCLRLDPDGTAVVYDQCGSRGAPYTGREPHYYVLRHFGSVIAETIDRLGAHYIVTSFGENHINLPSDACGAESVKRSGSPNAECFRPHSADNNCVGMGHRQNITEKINVIDTPRMFAVNCDGSGMELFRSDDVSAYLSKVERDPNSVVFTAPLPDCTDIYGTTVLRPFSKNMSQAWMKGYLLDSIIPAGLTSRDLRRVSSREVKVQELRDIKGSGEGCVLAKIRSVETQARRAVKCPPILEFRQLIKYQSVSDALRKQLTSALKDFADHGKKRAAYHNEISVADTQCYAEKELSEILQTRLSTHCVIPQTFACQDVKSVYERALTPVERPTITASAIARKKKYDLERVRQELAEEKECLRALRCQNISPYFKNRLSYNCSSRQDKVNKGNLEKQFVGYLTCGESVNADEMESCDDSRWIPLPGITCQHMSPEPEHECTDDVEQDGEQVNEGGEQVNEDGEKVNELPNADDGLMTSNVERSHQDEANPTDEEAVNLFGRSAENLFESNICRVSEELITSDTLQDREKSAAIGNNFSEENCVATQQYQLTNEVQTISNFSPAADNDIPTFQMPDFKGILADLMSGKNPIEVENSLNANQCESKSSSSMQSDAKLLEKCKPAKTPIVNDSEVDINETMKLFNSNRKFEWDDCNKQNNAQQSSTESEPITSGDDPDSVQVVARCVDASNDNCVCPQQTGFDRLTVHMDHGNDNCLQQDEAVTEKSDDAKCTVGTDVRYLIRNTQNECQHSDAPCVPGYVSYGKRPGASPNKKFACIEDPIRRKVNNVVITGATATGFHAINCMRGLEMAPERVDFGILKEGNTYTYNLSLKNTGVDACRFRVKQPPPATGVKILYKPGPVAAGMKADVQVEIYAIAAGVEGDRGVGLIAHNVEIMTETDQMMLPVTATVLTANEFDCRGPDSPRGQKAPGVKLISSKPPAGVGMIRPRKNLMHGGSVIVNRF